MFMTFLIPVQVQVQVQEAGKPSNATTAALIARVCDAAKINIGFGDIDVCHRLGTEPRSPIIIRFVSKSARYSFYDQRSKLKDIDTLKIDYQGLPRTLSSRPHTNPRAGNPGVDRGGHHNGSGGTRKVIEFKQDTTAHDIFVQEHLTKATKTLLKETKEAMQGMEYKYPGYIKDGTVRIKKFDNDKPIIIQCKRDLERYIKK